MIHALLPTPVSANGTRSAFTLIELSIVLVIIGLIVGGVLVGQDLIRAAQMRQQISQIEEIELAVNTFRLTYNCLPGDCGNATRFFAGSTQPEQVTNGDGDRRIMGGGRQCGSCTGYDYDGNMYWPRTGEWSYAMDHLAAAGLISLPQFDEADNVVTTTPGTGFPALKYPSKGGQSPSIQYPHPSLVTTNQSFEDKGGIVFGYQPPYERSSWYPSGHLIRLSARHTVYGGTTPGLSFMLGFQPWEARQMDEKMDDGKPYSGKVVGDAGGIFITRVQGWGGGDWLEACGIYSSNTYRSESNIKSTGGQDVQRVCAMTIKASF